MTDQPTPDLRPCPFCGEEPHLHRPSFKGDEWQVGCYCGDDEHNGNDACWRSGATFEEVAEKWNRRPDRGLAACVDYEHWASEITRLTAAIGECRCPKESPRADEDGFPGSDEPSCFQVSSKEEFDAGPENPPSRRNLEQIAKDVADCAACSELVRLIAERRKARQRWGVAKRLVRSVARAQRRTTGPAEEVV